MSCFYAVAKTEQTIINLNLYRIQAEADPKTRHPEDVRGYSPNWPANPSIEFKNFSVKYRPNLPYVINDLSLVINSGEKV